MHYFLTIFYKILLNYRIIIILVYQLYLYSKAIKPLNQFKFNSTVELDKVWLVETLTWKLPKINCNKIYSETQ